MSIFILFQFAQFIIPYRGFVAPFWGIVFITKNAVGFYAYGV